MLGLKKVVWGYFFSCLFTVVFVFLNFYVHVVLVFWGIFRCVFFWGECFVCVCLGVFIIFFFC